MVIQPGAITDKGKQKAKAFIKRDTVTDKLWQDHLKGVEPALGIIPINENNMCKWGCIDVDDYTIDLSSPISSHWYYLGLNQVVHICFYFVILLFRLVYYSLN